jgi:hypothetical protein
MGSGVSDGTPGFGPAGNFATGRLQLEREVGFGEAAAKSANGAIEPVTNGDPQHASEAVMAMFDVCSSKIA